MHICVLEQRLFSDIVSKGISIIADLVIYTTRLSYGLYGRTRPLRDITIKQQSDESH